MNEINRRKHLSTVGRREARLASLRGGQPGLSDKGLVTDDRKMHKDAYHFYRAHWSRAPMVHIASPHLTPRAAGVPLASGRNEIAVRTDKGLSDTVVWEGTP